MKNKIVDTIIYSESHTVELMALTVLYGMNLTKVMPQKLLYGMNLVRFIRIY